MRVSCDIQIDQLINGIKCASVSSDCVTLCHCATVINIRILDLKPLPTFLHNFIIHYVWIFTSRIFLKKKKLSGLLSLSFSEVEITITTIPIGPFVVILSQIKELIAAGHQPAADPILERFEIFSSMVPWFNQSVTAALCSQRSVCLRSA